MPGKVVVPVKTTWMGMVAISSLLVRHALNNNVDILIVFKNTGDRMRIPCFDLQRKMRCMSICHYKDKWGRENHDYRLVYYDWKPQVSQGVLV